MSANTSRRISVIGGGIAGLTTALSFAQTGAIVTVYEQAAAITEVGAGLQITPNGMRVLRALGLTVGGIAADAVIPMDGISGRQVARFDLSDRDYRFFHRADLIDLLADGCRAAGVDIQTGKAISPDDALLADATLVVGADGLHSKMRTKLNGTGQPFFTGQVAWRAIVPHDEANVARIWMTPGAHVVTYPLGGGRLNVVAVQERAEWADEGWHHHDDPVHLQNAFGNAAPELRKILNKVESPRLWGLFRHEVAAVWAQDYCAIVGDAAHPTLPFLAQGANLAIEDSYVLAKVCAANISLDRALPQYQALRRDRAMRAIAAANANAVNYHLSGMKRRVAHAGLGVLGRVAPDAFLNRLSWLYDHDVTA